MAVSPEERYEAKLQYDLNKQALMGQGSPEQNIRLAERDYLQTLSALSMQGPKQVFADTQGINIQTASPLVGKAYLMGHTSQYLQGANQLPAIAAELQVQQAYKDAIDQNKAFVKPDDVLDQDYSAHLSEINDYNKRLEMTPEGYKVGDMKKLYKNTRNVMKDFMNSETRAAMKKSKAERDEFIGKINTMVVNGDYSEEYGRILRDLVDSNYKGVKQNELGAYNTYGKLAINPAKQIDFVEHSLKAVNGIAEQINAGEGASYGFEGDLLVIRKNGQRVASVSGDRIRSVVANSIMTNPQMMADLKQRVMLDNAIGRESTLESYIEAAIQAAKAKFERHNVETTSSLSATFTPEHVIRRREEEKKRPIAPETIPDIDPLQGEEMKKQAIQRLDDLKSGKSGYTYDSVSGKMIRTGNPQERTWAGWFYEIINPMGAKYQKSKDVLKGVNDFVTEYNQNLAREQGVQIPFNPSNPLASLPNVQGGITGQDLINEGKKHQNEVNLLLKSYRINSENPLEENALTRSEAEQIVGARVYAAKLNSSHNQLYRDLGIDGASVPVQEAFELFMQTNPDIEDIREFQAGVQGGKTDKQLIDFVKSRYENNTFQVQQMGIASSVQLQPVYDNIAANSNTYYVQTSEGLRLMTDKEKESYKITNASGKASTLRGTGIVSRTTSDGRKIPVLVTKNESGQEIYSAIPDNLRESVSPIFQISNHKSSNTITLPLRGMAYDSQGGKQETTYGMLHSIPSKYGNFGDGFVGYTMSEGEKYIFKNRDDFYQNATLPQLAIYAMQGGSISPSNIGQKKYETIQQLFESGQLSNGGLLSNIRVRPAEAFGSEAIIIGIPASSVIGMQMNDYSQSFNQLSKLPTTNNK